MFRVNETFRMPSAFDRLGGEATDHYRLVEIALQLPVWFLRVATKPQDSDGISFWRGFLARDASEAIEILKMDHWASSSLQVFLPGHITGLEQWALHVCDKVWECDEPEGDAVCWRIETPEGPFLDSAFGTKVGGELKRRLVWPVVQQLSS